MIKFSVNIHRGCFGGCAFCTISAQQGKFIVSRSKENILKEEIGIIFEKQKAFGSLYVTDAFSEKYLEILFSQRAFEEGPGEESPYAGNQIEKMVGKCTFEKEEKRASKATYTFELFNLWQKINSIGILQDGMKRRLTDDERNKLFALCHKTEKIDYKRIRKELTGARTSSGVCGLIRRNAKNLTKS